MDATVQASQALDFLASQGIDFYQNQYSLNSKKLSGHYSTGLVTNAAVAALVADPEKGKHFVKAFWAKTILSGKWRYYDGMFYILALMQVSGHFLIYPPAGIPPTL